MEILQARILEWAAIPSSMGIFPTQGSDPGLLHCRWTLYQLSYMGSYSSSIPGLGRSPGEGIGHPLQCSWAPLGAQTVKNLPAMQETWVQSLGWEDPLEEGMATHTSILAWRIPLDREPGRLQTVHGVIKSGHD